MVYIGIDLGDQGGDISAAHGICSACGEWRSVRLIDNDSYIPDELICEECFSHPEAGWDDLPIPE